MDKDIRENLDEETKEEIKEETIKENEDNIENSEEVDDKTEEKNECDPAFEIKRLKSKLEEQEDALMRINAEYANYRRRTQEEKSSIGMFANEKIMSGLIPVIDNMERALSSFEDKTNSLYVGVEMVYNQMLDSLKNAGLTEIPAEVGTDFDHNLHMAVMQEPSKDHGEGKILMVLQKGYMLGNKVLRATMVKVSS